MRIVITEPAWESFDQAVGFLQAQWSDKVIDRIVARIWESIGLLAVHPHGGQVEEDLAYLSKGHRRTVVGHFKIIYYVDGDVVYVTDIFDSRQDPGKMKG